MRQVNLHSLKAAHMKHSLIFPTSMQVTPKLLSTVLWWLADLLLVNCKKSCPGLPADSCSEVASRLAMQQLPTWLQPQLSAGGLYPAGPRELPGGLAGGRRTGGLTQHRGQPPPHSLEGTYRSMQALVSRTWLLMSTAGDDAHALDVSQTSCHEQTRLTSPQPMYAEPVCQHSSKGATEP